MRLALVLLALGKDLLCSPVSLPFLAGDFIAGCGISFLLLDGGLDFPCVGLLSCVMLDVAPVDFFWVAGSVGEASFVLFQGQDDDGRCMPEGGHLVAKMLEVSSGTLVGLLSCRSCFFTDSSGTRGGAMCRRCVHEDPGSVK